MKSQSLSMSLVVALCALRTFAAGEAASSSTFLYVDTAQSPFWRTATNNTMQLSIDYPERATAASLDVRGAGGYSFSDQNVAEGLYVLKLPAATDPRSEDVYDLTLSFDNGETHTARFAVVCGVTGGGGKGSARCITPQSSLSWRRVFRRAVLPVPYLARLLDGNGEPVDTGLDGAAGWYALGPLAVGAQTTLSLDTADDGVFSATLAGAIDGTRLILR